MPATMALIAVNAVIFLLEETWGGSTNTETLVRMGAVYTGNPEWFHWGSLIAAAYLHFGLIHIAMNMFALYNVGRALERLLGASRFFVLYALSSLGGGAAMALSPSRSLAAGASGAVFGLFGAFCVHLYMHYRASSSDRERRAIRSTIGQLMLPNIVISLLPGISLLGHLGGCVTGAAVMAVIYASFTRSHDIVVTNRRFAAAAVLLATLTVAAIASVWLELTPWQHAA